MFPILTKLLIFKTFAKNISFPCQIKYRRNNTVTMIPGSGTGPELMDYLKEIFKVVKAPVTFEIFPICPEKSTQADLDEVIKSIEKNRVAIKGNIEALIDLKSQISFNVILRKKLDLHISFFHCTTYKNIRSRFDDLDIIVLRQNTEGEYSLLEHESVPGVVESLKITTKYNTDRIVRYAFEYAKNHCRKIITTVHKANIMKLSDGLFLETSRKIAKEYPDITFKELIIDNCCMQLVAKPQQFDIILTTNLYGTILTNILSGLIGGPGLLSGKNYNEKYAIFEQGCRTVGKELEGKNEANPTAMLNAGIDLLRHLGCNPQADIIDLSIRKTIEQDRVQTADLGGCSSSNDYIKQIIKNINCLQCQ